MTTATQALLATCKVIAASSREALRLVRERLGPDAIVLSNRVIAEGVEIVATLESSAEEMAIPERQVPGPDQRPVETRWSVDTPLVPGIVSDEEGALRENKSVRGLIEERLAGLSWNEAQRREPLRGHLLRTLLGAGFSARLAKDLLKDLPPNQSYASGLSYVKSALARDLPMLENDDALMDAGGVYALMGPTGVGKTTTTAKLAARCVMRFGAEKLALVTTDSYRIGAYEQLRIYGQILGVSVYAVKDAVDLELVLKNLREKHMVLIDTVGRSQRDRAVSDQIAMLCSAGRPVKRLLLLNASSHGDTLNEVVQAYRCGEQTANEKDLVGCIFTKVDEATHPGVLIDMAIRHQLPLHYISSGQKVPEHLALGDRNGLIDSVFQAHSQSSFFIPGEADLDERLVALSNDADVAAAEAVSERLRSQCHQLIRVLGHNSHELTSLAMTLAAGQIGFDETRLIWRNLSDDRIGEEKIARNLLAQAIADSKLSCHDYVLAITGEISLTSEQSAEASPLVSSLLLSDKTGFPFAAPYQFPLTPAPSGRAQSGWIQQQKFGRPVVHLLSRIPASARSPEWPPLDCQWVASASAACRIVEAGNGTPGTLEKLAAGLTFSASQPAIYRGKAALLSVAEALVGLRPHPKNNLMGEEVAASTLRCVVKRFVDVNNGKTLAHSYVLASSGLQATALQVAQWSAWRALAEPYFKLYAQGVVQLASTSALGGASLTRRFLIAGQASTTVFRLQRARGAWAETARKILAQLAGRSVRSDRPIPGLALFEGLGKLFVLRDALETDAAAASPQSDTTQVQL